MPDDTTKAPSSPPSLPQNDLAIARHMVLSTGELQESVRRVHTSHETNTLPTAIEFSGLFESVQKSCPLPTLNPTNWEAWLSAVRLHALMTETSWVFAPDCLTETLRNHVTVNILTTIWRDRLALSAKITQLNRYPHPIDVLVLVSAEFGPPSSLASLNAYAAHWRLALDRFPTLKHFLSDFRSFRRLVYDDDGIPMDSSFWTKVLVATMRRDYSDKISEWIQLKPDELLNILDGIAFFLLICSRDAIDLCSLFLNFSSLYHTKAFVSGSCCVHQASLTLLCDVPRAFRGLQGSGIQGLRARDASYSGYEFDDYTTEYFRWFMFHS